MRTFEIDGVEHTNIRLDSVALVESAYGGEVGIGGFDREDPLAGDVPALKPVIITEDLATPDRLYTGYTSVRGLARGRMPMVELQRTWDVTLLDLNTVLDDEIFRGDSANRPEETDFARITWLLTTSAISALGITAGVVPNTNTVLLDATDYRGKGPRAVLDDSAESAAKNYFVYDWGAGPKLYYDKHTGTSLSSTLKLSSVLSDVDLATVFPLSRPNREDDPIRIYSGVRYEYEGGHVWVENAATAATYRQREVNVVDATVKSATKATNKANKYLTAASTEEVIFTCDVSLPAQYVNHIRAGMRIEIHCPHLNIDEFTWFRITRRRIEPQPGRGGASEDRYTLSLEFASDVKMTSFGSPRPPTKDDGAGPEAETAPTGDALTLSCFYARKKEYIHPANGPEADFEWNTDLLCTFATTNRYVRSVHETNIPWGSTNCPISTGAWDGRDTTEAWFAFNPGALDGGEVGVELVVPAATTFYQIVSPDEPGVVGSAAPYMAGVAHAVPTDLGQFIPLGTTPCGTQHTWLIPRSLLVPSTTNYFVIAPVVKAVLGYWCVNDYSAAIGNAGGFQPKAPTAKVVALASSGYTQWVPGIGDVDGSNRTFELISWTGEGIPEARVGVVILGAGDYTWDAGTKTVTLLRPPPVGTDVRFRYWASI